MPLSGLDIYKLLPKTNCKDCGYSTCLAFAMALAQKKTALEKCPHVTAGSKEALESASQPPIKLVTIGKGANKIEVGNETVMHRHEQKFHHPAAIGFLVEDTLDDEDLSSLLKGIGALKFERAGQKMGADIVCIKNSSKYLNKFLNAIRKTVSVTGLNLALLGSDPEVMSEAIKMCREARPLIVCDDRTYLNEFIKLAKENNVPLAIPCKDIEEAADLTAFARSQGLEELVINLKTESLAGKIQDYTFIRRSSLKKNIRALGYPIISFTGSSDVFEELAEAVTFVAKYSGIVIARNAAKEFAYPLLVARQDIYTDPQKPVQVEPRIYEIGKVSQDSPVIVTTNFSITYFTVAGEIEASKVPAYVICCDAEGMSVLTAWAAEKFTAERIAAVLKNSGIEKMVDHRSVIIPGYVSVISGKLEDASGWKVVVGPREASGIPSFLRSYK
ncbi:MAG TPA: acetyl-CoA decarbonylase/synthase complex subunit gamma [Candidatus Omnitrophota bacterium]|nr:acetyl-CoA decarbonylase/synthase complex subunit gamma [Candidatus Omnitrophota bacterium]